MSPSNDVGVALERARPNGVALTDDERRWDRNVRLANVFANSNLVSKNLQSNPSACMSAIELCDSLHIDPRTMMGSIDVIEGRLEPRGQVYLTAANVHGWETKWGRIDRDVDGNFVRVRAVEPDDERAELLIRPYGAGDDAWESYSFTIAQAERAGLLDEWVEKRVADGKWPDGNTRWTTEKFVLGRAGVDIPEWADAKIRAGEIKHRDNWFKYPADMLAAKAAKRAVKRAAPAVMFGAIPATVPPSVAAAVAAHLPDDDDEIFDAEIVTEPSAGPVTQQGREPLPQDADGPAEPHRPKPRPAGYPLRPEDQATDLERRAVELLRATLTPTQDARLEQLAGEAAVPNIRGARFSHDHAVLVLDLIASIQAETTTKTAAAGEGEASATAEPVADGPSPPPSGDGPPQPTGTMRRPGKAPGPSANQPSLDEGRPFDE